MNIQTSRNEPLSQQYYEAGTEWADLDGAARLLEESKTAVLSQRCKALGDMPVARAEQETKSSPEWRDYIKKMVDARTRANKAKIRMEFLRLRFMEWNSQAATERATARM